MSVYVKHLTATNGNNYRVSVDYCNYLEDPRDAFADSFDVLRYNGPRHSTLETYSDANYELSQMFFTILEKHHSPRLAYNVTKRYASVFKSDQQFDIVRLVGDSQGEETHVIVAGYGDTQCMRDVAEEFGNWLFGRTYVVTLEQVVSCEHCECVSYKYVGEYSLISDAIPEDMANDILRDHGIS